MTPGPWRLHFLLLNWNLPNAVRLIPAQLASDIDTQFLRTMAKQKTKKSWWQFRKPPDQPEHPLQTPLDKGWNLNHDWTFTEEEMDSVMTNSTEDRSFFSRATVVSPFTGKETTYKDKQSTVVFVGEEEAERTYFQLTDSGLACGCVDAPIRGFCQCCDRPLCLEHYGKYCNNAKCKIPLGPCCSKAMEYSTGEILLLCPKCYAEEENEIFWNNIYRKCFVINWFFWPKDGKPPLH